MEHPSFAAVEFIGLGTWREKKIAARSRVFIMFPKWCVAYTKAEIAVIFTEPFLLHSRAGKAEPVRSFTPDIWIRALRMAGAA